MKVNTKCENKHFDGPELTKDAGFKWKWNENKKWKWKMNIFMDLSLTVEVGQAEKPGCNVFTWGSYHVYVFIFAPFPFSLCLFFFFVPFLLSLLPGWKIPTPEYYSIDLSTRPVIMSRSVWQLEGWWPSGFSRLFHYWHRKSAGAGNSVVSPTWLDSPGSFVKPFETPSTT